MADDEEAGGDGAGSVAGDADARDAAGGGAGDAAKAKNPKRRKKHEAGVALGAAIAGFEQAVFRKLPPPHEVVAQSRHHGPVAAADGTMFTLLMPGDPPRVADDATQSIKSPAESESAQLPE